MKTKFLIFFLLTVFRATATDYFVNNNGGSGAGTSDATAWNIAKAQQMYNTLYAGDRLLFRAGQTFYTYLPITEQTGVAGSPITYGSYGAGAKPIISGLQTVTGWTPHPTIAGVYYASFDVPELQVVTVDGVMRQMGRYPKTGYMNIDSHSGRTSLTSSAIASMPFNPQGGRAVIKKARYIIDRQNILTRVGNTITIDEPNDDYGNANSIYELSDGNGWFVQAHVGTLTQLGDWYYDKIAKRLYVHFGGGNSSSHVIQAALYRDLASCMSRSFITFENLDLRGANLNLINAQYSNHIVVNNCYLTMASNGVVGLQGGGFGVVTNNTMEDLYNSSISTWETPNWIFSNNYTHRIHAYAGMGLSGDLNGSGVTMTGNDLTITYNRVVYSGYNGISFYGSYPDTVNGVAVPGKAGHNVLVANNYVDSFCINKDDGGGIYTYGSVDQKYNNRVIKNNIVTNGIGNKEGAGFFTDREAAMGIYLDNFSQDVRVEGNYVSHNTGAGIFFNSNRRDTAINNTVVDNDITAFLNLYTTNQINDQLYVTGNTFISMKDRPLVNFEMYQPLSLINTIGTFANNIYYSPFGTQSFFRIDDRQNQGMVLTDRTLSQWQSTFGKEQGSVVSTAPITSPTAYYEVTNFSPSPVTVPPTTVKRDVQNNSYSSEVQVGAYSGMFLIDTGIPIGLPATNFLKIYRKVRQQ